VIDGFVERAFAVVVEIEVDRLVVLHVHRRAKARPSRG
jgi:hypothetical protein